MNKFVIVDLETTGQSPKKGDRIIQFAGVVIENYKIVDIYTTYIDPEVPISPFITELTGITNQMVQSAPSFSEVAEEIRALFEDACFVAHNVHFDFSFLQGELENCHLPKLTCQKIDTVELTRILMPTLESYKLSDIALNAGFDHDRPHQADSDALVTAEWFLELMEKIDSLPMQTLQQLCHLSKHLKTDLSFLLNDRYMEKINHTFPLSDQLTDVRGIVIKKHLHRSPFRFDTHKKDETEAIRYLEMNLKSMMLSEVQKDYIRYCYRALNEGEVAIAEASPDLEKEELYLIAAGLFSLFKQKRVLVAVSTIQKQHQLLKIAKKIQQYIPSSIHTAVLKGKNHYLNLWKFERILREETNHYDDVITKMQILVWLTETETGDVSELNLTSGGWQLWRRLSLEPVTRTKENPWWSYDFYQRANEKAKAAQIVITNHHFLMKNLTSEQQQIPEFEHLIIDEAHVFEKNAAMFFGHRLSFHRLNYLLNQFGNLEQMKLLGKVEKILRTKKRNLKADGKKVQYSLNQFIQNSSDFFRVCYELLKRNKTYRKNGKITISLNLTKHKGIIYSWERTYYSFQELYDHLEERLFLLMDMYDDLMEADQVLIDDFSLLLTDFYTIKKTHNEFFGEQAENKVIWIEADERNPQYSLTIYSQPILLDNYFSEYLYMKMKTIFFTSHTLTINHSFDFICGQLGLQGFPVLCENFLTSDHFMNLPQLFALDDGPHILDVDEQEYIEYISNHIIAITEAVRGKLLITFSSHEMLRKTYLLIKESGMLDEYLLLAQGISGGSVSRLIKQFNQFEKAALFISSTNLDHFSLENLQTIIMVRLPFSSPDDPIFAKKAKILESKGDNSFYYISLPEAILRFRQVFNQLIKTNEGSTKLIILDKRIYQARYGKDFLRFPPGITLQIVDLNTLLDIIEV